MKGKERVKFQREALKLYLKGTGRDIICDQLKISHATFDRWKASGKWAELYDSTQSQATANIRREAGIDIEKEKSQDLKVLNTLQNIFKAEINRQIAQKDMATLPKNTQLYTGILKAKWEILMPKTVSQYNFMKAETHNGPKYTLEILNPDDTNQVEAKQEATPSVADTPRQDDD